MAGRDRHLLLGFMVLLAGVSPGALGLSVNYPGPVCGVKGSQVTLPCTFSPLKSFSLGGTEVPIEILRVGWCRDHVICRGETPSVYDSDKPKSNPRYRYLGDKEGSCSLQISDLQEEDDATLRFWMEKRPIKGSFTGQPGVRVTVRDGEPMKISGSRESDRAVSLLCSARCTFHQLEVSWSRDGHALPQSGPALRLSALTAEDSGNYTCALKNDPRTESLPYRLHVEAADGASGPGEAFLFPVLLTVGLLCGVLLIILPLLFLYRYRKSKGSVIIRSQSTNQGPATDHMINQDEIQNMPEYSTLLHGDRCLYERIGGPVEAGDGASNEPEESIYINVAADQ